jgi:Fe-S cluster biosynthesis and repair protein YggX
MPIITCARCHLDREGQSFQPFPNDIGKRLFEGICGVCWGEWLKYQQQLINHYALDLREAKAKAYLIEQMEQFLFTSEPPA